ncbi:N-acetyltransferase [Paenibacillus silviterrae]|uniref:N-acetyltransferase n=1 Tax=Paenibacillus silviterrae TaxID=3242194 RepID=UPI002542FB35|nr:acyltransferase [Paenibacillus chinjuensis]
MYGHVTMGRHVVVGNNVTFGSHVVIGHNVIIYDGTVIGSHVVIHDNAVIGKKPMKALNSATTQHPNNLPPATIGDYCTVGTSAIIYADAHLGDHVFVADLATVRERVVIGSKTIIGRGVAVENNCTIGENCKLETNSYICAYSTLEDFVFIAPCVVTTNDNYVSRTKERFGKFKGATIKRGGRIGANATILPGRIVAEDSLVAAGSTVTRDVPAKEIVAGTPAKKLRDVPPEQWLENQ